MAGKFTRFSEKRDHQSDDVSSYDDAVDAIEPDEASGLHIPIHEENVGFRLIQKMGWTTGTGLGKNKQGRVDPVPLVKKDDSMGLGRFEMELDKATKTTEKRKQMEIEKELTTELIGKYKDQVERELDIADSTAELRKSYFCELCDKQYTKYSEYDNHLNSYDHHHRQRLKELRQYDAGRRFKGHRSMEEEEQRKAAVRMVVIERAEMTAKRLMDGSSGPGFKPIGLGRGKRAEQQIVKQLDTGVCMQTSKRSMPPSESELKIAEKKARLAKYGVKFESAGHLASIKDEPDQTRLTSYQSLLLNSSLAESSETKSHSSSSSLPSNLYSGRFVSATMSDQDGVKEAEEDMKEKKKELSEHLRVVGATKRKLEKLEKDTEEEEKGGWTKSGEEDGPKVPKQDAENRTAVSAGAASASASSKKPAMSLGGKFTIKLAGKRFESFYY